MSLTDILMLLDGIGFKVMTALLSVLWQSTILLVTAGALTFFLRKRSAAVRHAIWTVAALAIPFLPLLSINTADRGPLSTEIAILPLYEKPFSIAFENMPSVSDVASHSVVSSPFSLWDYPWALGLAGYLAVVFCALTWIIAGRLRLRRWLVNGGAVQDGRVLDTFHQAEKRLGITRHVPILEHPGVPAPLICGILRPAVILPADFAEGLADSELRAVAFHELAHIRRRDTAFFTLVSLLRAVFFFQPLLWLAGRRISFLAEAACDSAALTDGTNPATYAALLTRIASHLPRRSFPTEAAGILFSQSVFTRRVREILSSRIGKTRKLSRWALACIACAGMLSLFVAAALPIVARGYDRAAAVSTGKLDIEKTMFLPVRMFQEKSSQPALFGNNNANAENGLQEKSAEPDLSGNNTAAFQDKAGGASPQTVVQGVDNFDYDRAIKIAKTGDDLLRTARGKILVGNGEDKRTIFYKYDHTSGRMFVTYEYPVKPENPLRTSLLYDGVQTTTLTINRESAIAFTQSQFKLEESVYNPFLFEYFFYGKGISEILATRKIKLSGPPVGDLTYSRTVKMGNLDVDVFSIFKEGYEVFSLYLARQYLYRPVKMSINGKDGREVCVETCEYAKIGNGMFFPVKACDKLDGVHGNDIEFVIGETEINVPLSDEDFKLDIPEGVKVSDFRKTHDNTQN